MNPVIQKSNFRGNFGCKVASRLTSIFARHRNDATFVSSKWKFPVRDITPRVDQRAASLPRISILGAAPNFIHQCFPVFRVCSQRAEGGASKDGAEGPGPCLLIP